MRPDSSILGEAKGVESLVIVGCPYCANYSIAYEKDEPVQKLVIDGETGSVSRLPLAVINEANRLKGVLEDRGMSIGVEIWPALCYMTSDSEVYVRGPKWTAPELVHRCEGAEAIVALCCAGGVAGLKQCFGGGVKVIPAMKTEGIAFMSYSLDKETNLIHIDKEKSTIIRNL